MFVQIEKTPNPNSLKFLPGKVVSKKGSFEINKKDETNNELLRNLLSVIGVQNIFLGNDFISINKNEDVSWEEIKQDEDTYEEIKKIWDKVGGVRWNDAVDDEWMESFYKQQKVLLEKIGKPKFTEFTRDSSQDGSPYRLPDSKRSG